ncbi:hypothetical protein AAFF_G00008520 [Aldrovandia affinis]|uniref:Coiled-coil domain-containing protein 138 n=1 Tax=Aldrovandia affinis TaxID=143900 RepID=A0AAD7X0Q8_9TELE|nr:hypothetical protein AAFF_G00008520 [Aldrovandia affinis]
MSNESSETYIDFTVEKLKKKYLDRRKLVPKENIKRSGFGDSIDNLKPCDFPLGTRISSTEESPQDGYKYHDRKRYDKALQELFKAVRNVPERLDQVGEWAVSPDVSEDEHSTEEHDSPSETRNNLNTETDVTLPSSLTRTTGSCVTDTVAPVAKNPKRPSPQGSSLSATDISQVYQEMVQIYEKLHTERTHQQQWSAQLQEREACLQEREACLQEREACLQEREACLQQSEALVLRPHHALLKIRGVEEEVHSHMRGLQEQHQQEIQQLNDVLKEKNRENRRIKANFDSIKEINDTMRNQLNDITEQNRKLEGQSRKVQARLENLQRKNEYSMAQKGRENVAPKAQGAKPSKQDKTSLPTKPNKASASPSLVRLLVLLMDWILDCHLVPPALAPGDGKGAPGQSVPQAGSLQTGSVQEKCSKVLPMLTEQLQLVPGVDAGLLVPLLKFIYWSLRQLDNTPQQNTLTSTMRRLGEEVYRGTGQLGGTFDPSTRIKTSALFKSPCLGTRFPSTLIVLSTINQADILAQALDSLHDDLRCEEGRELFLWYRALPVVLAHLRGGSRGPLAVAVDILLQMAAESRLLNPFLEACSTEDFFRCIASLLRNPRLDVTLVEKASILLQKLSKIRKNKRLFELFTIHLMIQEMHRTADPAHAFLSVNLNSILYHLGMMRSPVCPSPADRP